MYDKMRAEILRELMNAGIDPDAVIPCIDRVAVRYTVAERVGSTQSAIEVLESYLACRKFEKLAEGTLYNYRVFLSRMLETIGLPLSEITSNDLRRYIMEYQAERGTEDVTLNKYREYVCTFFGWAYHEGLIDRNPTSELRTIRHEKKQRPYLTQMDLEYIRNACRDLRESAIVEVLYSTGCRASELCGLRKEDVDWTAGTVHLYGKGRKHRTSYLNAKAIVALRQYIDSRNDDSEWLFVTRRAPVRAIKVATLEKHFRELTELIGGEINKKLTPHLFRHTTATTALRNGMPVEEIRELLGHENIETTMVYAKASGESVQSSHRKYVV